MKEFFNNNKKYILLFIVVFVLVLAINLLTKGCYNVNVKAEAETTVPVEYNASELKVSLDRNHPNWVIKSGDKEIKSQDGFISIGDEEYKPNIYNGVIVSVSTLKEKISLEDYISIVETIFNTFEDELGNIDLENLTKVSDDYFFGEINGKEIELSFKDGFINQIFILNENGSFLYYSKR